MNVWLNLLDAAGLPVGAWLKALKAAVRDDLSGDTPIALPGGGTATLGSLKPVVSVERGQKIGYVTDIADTSSNRRAVAALCSEADLLFIEASFAAEHAERAAARAHLTTTAAGEIGRESRARRLEPFHFSSRYEGHEALLLQEVQRAFHGE